MTKEGYHETLGMGHGVCPGDLVTRYGLTMPDALKFFDEFAALMKIRSMEAMWKVIEEEIEAWMRGERPTEPGGRGLPPEGAKE